MSIDQRIAQRFMTWIPGKKPTKQILSVVKSGNLGGILLNSANIENRSQIRDLIDTLQNLALGTNPPVGLFVGVDQEGGRVSRFALKGMTRFPAPYYLGEHRDEELIRSVAYIIGTELRALGCNMNLAPVLDLYDRPDRSIIGDRSLGNDPQIVGRLGLQYLLGAKRAGVIPVIKHFPGQGVTDVDSHHRLPVVPAAKQALVERGIEPFRIAIGNGAEAVMTAHVLYEGLDPQHPCTLSRKIINGILREEMGFEGIVLSDAIEMGALRNNYDIREIIRLCIKAGIDLLLVNGIFSVQDLIKTTSSLLEAGEITIDEIDSGVERILRIKAKNGLLRG
jgi:beta-N-acetylhexosaminidase